MDLYFYSPSTPSWCVAQLKKHRDTFTFLLLMRGDVIEVHDIYRSPNTVKGKVKS
jgi:hypothetical protein